MPVSEFQLTTDTIRRFRLGYVEAFGAATRDDQLYEAVSEGRRYPGMEHWLPLFHERMDTLLDYLGRHARSRSSRWPKTPRMSGSRRSSSITRRGRMRRRARAACPTSRCRRTGFISPRDEWKERLARSKVARLTPFAVPDADAVDIGTKQGHNFSAERAEPNANVFDAVTRHVAALQRGGKSVVIALWSEGARDRMSHVLRDHGLANLANVASWQDALARPKTEVALAVLGLESGFESAQAAIISEQDILGDRLVRPRRASRRAENFIAEATSLSAGDLVVHVDHGIGRFVGLQTVEAAGAPHDCLELHYAGDTKLYLPVENIDLLSRYGSEDLEVELDRLGGSGWQTRKARMKNRIREIAHELMKVAAERKLREAPKLVVAPGMYDEFCAELSLRGDRGSAGRDRRRARRSRLRPADGSAGLRRCRLRQDRGGVARGLRRGDERQAGRGGGADHVAGAPALQDLHRALPRLSGEDRAGLAAGDRPPIWRRPARIWPKARSTSWSAPMRCSART